MAAKVKKVFPNILFTCHYAFNSHFLCIKATPSQSSAQVVLQQVKRLYETNRISANGNPTLSTSVVVPGGLPRANPVSAMPKSIQKDKTE
jgi:hypothetical protein